MKQTSDKLEFVDMYSFHFNLSLGTVLFVFGLFFAFSGQPVGYYFALFGFLLMTFAEIETIILDKNLGHVTIKQHKPLIAKTKLIKHLLGDISGVGIQEGRDNDGDKKYCVFLLMRPDR